MRSALNARPTASQGVAPAAAPNANPPAPGVPEVVPFCSAHVVPFYSALDNGRKWNVAHRTHEGDDRNKWRDEGSPELGECGWDVRKKDFQKLCGTRTPSAPAISSPPAISFHTDSQSMTKY